MWTKIKGWLNPSAEDPEFLRRFEEEEAVARVPNYRIASGLASIFIAAGSVMDRVAFDEDWPILVLLRGECSLTLLLIYALLGTEWGKKHHLIIGHFIEGSLVVSILAMIWVTGGGISPYYAGLNLVMVGASLLLRWSLVHGLVNVLLCCGGYSVLSWVMSMNIQGVTPEEYAKGVSTSSFFLFVTGFFTAAGTSFLYHLRMNEFRLREELTEERLRLEKSHEKLKELDESKTRFFANMSHELRTPLTLILGPIEDLSSFQPIRENASMRRMVTAMEENGLRLLRLINELLDLIRLDGSENEKREEICELTEIVSSTRSSFYPVMDKKGLKLIFDVEQAPIGYYRVERMKVEKVLLNLISNAVKFTPSGGTVGLSLRKCHTGEFEIKVSDTGRGMSREELQNVFRRFWQADTSAKRKHRGAGIGLSLVKGLVDSMGGKISVTSVIGMGTTFKVLLPLVSANGDEVEKDAPVDPSEDEDLIETLYAKAHFEGNLLLEDPDGPSTEVLVQGSGELDSPTVLVAEDEPAVRELLVAQLKEYRLLVANDGQKAFDMAKERKPDLILLDWMMPELDGLEVTRLIRQVPGLERTPVILLTARIDERSKIEGLEAGANDFLTKPFVPTELKLRIDQLLKSRRYQTEIVEKSLQLGKALDDLKESESMLVQAEKLSSLGQMSAGIIHEINNPINYAKTNLYSLRTFSRSLPEDEQEDYREVLADVEEGLQRVAQIVQDLRGFAVKDKVRFGDVNLSEVVSTSARLVGHRLGGVDFEQSVPDHLHLTGNANQLCQVLVNFLQNSLDAVEGREFENNESPRVEVYAEDSAEGILLHLKDNGSGISPEIREQIFDPFFTSKDVGKGMGLGLSICYRILQQHGVKIDLESGVNQGTHFTLTFPHELPLNEDSPTLEATELE
ncbi:MAG: ATP-binding protein [Verrucomicrobiota bacterium JB023]|nr:ATP-binding protein [Verrucomicrobiota bacterium JB023]